MTQFEFFMTFYGLLLGLALAELLAGFGKLLRQRTRPNWGLFTPLAGAVVFVCLITAYSDAWASMRDISINMRSFMAPIAIGISLFLAALMAVPQDVGEWDGLDGYFLARRRLIFGPLITYNLILILTLEVPKGIANHSLSAAYVTVNATLVGLLCVPIVARRRGVIAGAMTAYIAVMVFIYFSSGLIQDQFERLFGINRTPVVAAPRTPAK